MPDADRGVDTTLTRMQATIQALTLEASYAADITFSAGVAYYPDDGVDARLCWKKRMKDVRLETPQEDV